MAKTQQRISAGEEQQHKGCMTIKIISANKAFLPAGVQGTEGRMRGRTRLVPPCPAPAEPARLPPIPGALALLQPPTPSDPSKQRFTAARVDSGGISQGVKMGFPLFFQGCGISSRSHFCGAVFVLGEMCSRRRAQTLSHTLPVHYRAVAGCSSFLFPTAVILKTIESRNHSGWKRPLGSSSPAVKPALPSPNLSRCWRRLIYLLNTNNWQCLKLFTTSFFLIPAAFPLLRPKLYSPLLSTDLQHYIIYE